MAELLRGACLQGLQLEGLHAGGGSGRRALASGRHGNPTRSRGFCCAALGAAADAATRTRQLLAPHRGAQAQGRAHKRLSAEASFVVGMVAEA